MGKDKLRRFRENETFACFVQPAFEEVFRTDHPFKGHWAHDFFGNDRPVVLELGCGKGEYTVALAQRDPSRNYIGIDIKGARMWRGAKTATERGMTNVAFLRTRIEFIDSLFGEGEVAEIWITFPDPQLKTRRAAKRLTSPDFLTRWLVYTSPSPR
ncbi:MAG: tRNA (guanosine(46)-N7)-methyltransferase TrmB, partial [Alistipes sp.]|nr:tRNA (guanosine(46)-N7)-methyltransferase TrmB [Alistipes sp.]